MKIICCFFVFVSLSACSWSSEKLKDKRNTDTSIVFQDTMKTVLYVDTQQVSTTKRSILHDMQQVMPKGTQHALVSFAKTLIGIPYKYASTDPYNGFDCSGFITYVFNHFNIDVPRSSIDFTYVGKEISVKNAKEGDLILFTGTADSASVVGHMGIVIENADTLKFIHSSSGRAHGVTISELNDYYEQRFVKVIRVFPEQIN